MSARNDPSESVMRGDPAATVGDPRTPSGRAAIAELFLREYHRLGGAAARASVSDAGAAQALRRRASAWRTTAARVRGVADSSWPEWLLAHLAKCEALPIVGAEYTRQRVYLERITGRGPGRDREIG